MLKRAIALSLGVIFLATARLVERSLFNRSSLSQYPALQNLNNEGVLAVGRKLSLAMVGAPELTIIPGVSDGLAQSMDIKRQRILKDSMRLPKDRKHQALEVVKGIGPKRSISLNRYLEVAGTNSNQRAAVLR